MFILFSSLVSAQILINEVMYDPGQCPDAQCEWIELYNGVDEIIDISQCSLMGKELEGNISANSYKIILRDYENFSYYFKEPENYQEITFSLVNSGKELILNGSEWCNTSFDYTYLTNDKLANNNNLTLERRSDGTWGESLTQGGSPGEENSISEISIEFENIFITEFLANPFGEDGADKPNGEWIELYNDGEKTIDLKGLYFTDIKKENELIIAQTKTMGASTLIHPNNYKVIYKDGDSDFSLNNYDFEELSLYVGDAKIAYTNFAGSTEGMSWSLIDDIWHQTLSVLLFFQLLQLAFLYELHPNVMQLLD